MEEVLMNLYHFTDVESALKILRDGFQAGVEGKVWFAEHPDDCWGAVATEALIVVEVDKSAVSEFLIKGEIDVMDCRTKEWMIETEEVVNIYALPPEVANKFRRRIELRE